MSTVLIDRLCDMVAAGEMSRAGLARAAGLHPNSLRKLGDSDWNPTADTLLKLEKFLAGGRSGVMASAEQIIDEARNGRMFILVDDEDRENEGDLVIPAQMATPDAINFMAKHGRGLICLALTKDRVDRLGLPLMPRHNDSRLETAFTISIEAKEGVTTGISAADRARTVSVAIDLAKGREHLVTPGHVFPLVARDGGVLVRAGHTEAAVDVARLAGLNPSGVICEIMGDDGSMARMEDLFAFAQLHNLRIGTIRDLIAYRLKKDRLVEETAQAQFESRWGGTWTAKTFLNKASGTEQIALVKGHVDPTRPTLVRMHALSLFSDAFAEAGSRGGLLEGAMKAIAEEGAGVIVVINRPMPDALSQALKVRAGDAAQRDSEQLRDYGVGAQILAALGVHDMILLTNSHHTPVALAGYGLAIVGERPIPEAAQG
ncbi:MAG TPA: 3,4-dihydroxy-2-butanone-4-phosphate synthase [Allosphingosinicella sp.]|nr:3,4-dihydroxy-2-butanone-4-phosphate synthase [Allosphingosinicella sp.]